MVGVKGECEGVVDNKVEDIERNGVVKGFIY